MAEALFSFRNISLSADGKPVFRNFSFDVQQDDKILFKGPSGTGKSSLFRLLLGFVIPDEGEILVRGKPLDGKSIWKLRQEIALVPQETVSGQVSVKELFSSFLGFQANKHFALVQEELIRLFSLFELDLRYLDKSTDSLSGGERQRVSIILALLLKRKILLLDEITASLDSNLKQIVANYFLGLTGSTVLSISHDPQWYSQEARVYDLEANRWVR